MKKKLLLLMICLLILPLCAYADDDSPDESPPNSQDEESPSDSFSVKDRKFELGFLFIDLSLTNNFLSLGEFFQKTIVLDIDKLAGGFKMNLGASITPVYFNINMDNSGIGLSINVEAAGIFDISGKMFTFSKAVDEKSGVNGALFASLEVNSYFNISKFKFKLIPSLFYTLAYLKPDISYTFDPDSGNIFKIDYDIQIFTAFPVQDIGSIFNDLSVLGTPGIDLSFGVEYAMSNDFDIGLDIMNVPILPSVLNYYMQYSGSIDEKIDLLGDGIDGLLSSFDNINTDPVYGKDSLQTARPFRLTAWINWRLFGTPFLTLTPMIGFSLNSLYVTPFTFEFGVNACLNLSNMFLVAAGINYVDRTWKNGVDLTVNLRVFEFTIGVDMRSPDFLKIWSGKGLGIRTGFKLGW